MQPPITITAKFGEHVVTAHRYSGRYSVDSGSLLWDDTPEAQRFRDAINRMAEVTGWTSNGGQRSLAGALSADWEPAHIFVALNLQKLASYFNGRAVTYRDAGALLWDLLIAQGVRG